MAFLVLPFSLKLAYIIILFQFPGDEENILSYFKENAKPPAAQ